MCTITTYKKETIFYRFNETGEFKIKEGLEDKHWGNAIYFLLERYPGVTYHNGTYPLTLKLKKELNVINCIDERFKNGFEEKDIPGLIQTIEKLTGKKFESYFLDWLGSLGYAFECYHDSDGNREIAIPKQLFKDNMFTIEFQK